MGKIRSSLVLSLFFCLLVGCGESRRSELPVPPPNILGKQKVIKMGQILFKAHCSECHGRLAEGRTQRAARFNPAAPDFYERRYRTALPGYLYLRIKWGNKLEPFGSRGSVMPSWAPHLKPDQIWSLVAYLRYRAGTLPLN